MSTSDSLQADLLAAIASAADAQALEAVRVSALGKQGRVTALLKTLGAMSPEQRQAEGPRIQSLREAVSAALVERKAVLDAAELDRRLATERLDLTLPAEEPPAGSIHPVSQVTDELVEIFADLGFSVAEGPEIEDDWHNFTALNIPETHPARAMHDTFYVERRPSEGWGLGRSQDGSRGEGSASGSRDPGLRRGDVDAGDRLVLRTHTSPVQIRALNTHGAPLRVIAPGRTYRSDSDATHTPMFHQVEGLVVGRGIHMGHLKWTLESFVRAFFERDDVILRLRPSYFPFTEPSAEVDVGFTWNNGRREIGGAEPDGWMEILGSGMVHPAVLRNVGLDPAEWSGFAFGCGIDRLAMLKYGMTDLRAFFDGDLRWLRQYGFPAFQVPTLSGGIGR